MQNAYRFVSLACVLAVICGVFSGSGGVTIAAQPQAQDEFRFDFGPGKVAAGYTQVLPDATYSDQRGYGFESGADLESIQRNGDDALTADFITAAKPFRFSVKVPEGNYRVMMIFGDGAGESRTTVKAELRRLMLEHVTTAQGQFTARTIIVNVRTPNIAGDREVRLKGRETTTEWSAWDEKLTLEFNDARPCLCAMEISRADDVPTVYILGDSTVCDQPSEPWNSWGQMLPRFFRPDVAIANHAESGESMRSSLGAGRVAKVMELIQPGDYLMAQFGHNDMKSRSPNALATYESDLKQLVADARAKGATPILITSMERKAGVRSDTLGQYPETVRQVAKADNVALIDLHAVSKVFYTALGSDLDKAFQDGTHHNNYGSYELAKCVAAGINQSVPGLGARLADGFGQFDPAHPDPVDRFEMPASPEFSTVRPLGD